MNSAPPPTAEHHHIHARKPAADAIRDIVLWKKKSQSIMLLLAATVNYVLLEVYQFNFLTLVSWAAMFVVSLLFLWGNIHRLIGKELRDMAGGMMMSEETAVEIANTVRESIEESIRWMFRVGAEGELFGFGTTVCFLWLISFVAGRVDALTFLYSGFVVGMIVPVTYLKYDGKIKEYGRRIKVQSQRCLEATEEKLKKLKSRVAGFDDDLKHKKTL